MQNICSLLGKNAVVTGASQGIGRAIARTLAQHGANVVAAYGTNRQAAEHFAQEAAEEIRDKTLSTAPTPALEPLQTDCTPPLPEETQKVDVIRQCVNSAAPTTFTFVKQRIVITPVDMQRIPSIHTLFRTAQAALGNVDIFVNSAGIARYNRVNDVTEEEYDRVMQINTKGSFFAMQKAARCMNDNGRIILLGTTVLKVMLPTYAVYAASKAAVEQMVRVFATEVGERGITVNLLSPGPTDTAMLRHGKTAEQLDTLGAMAPLNRLGLPEDMARVALFLASDASGWVTGQNIYANGGFA